MSYFAVGEWWAASWQFVSRIWRRWQFNATDPSRLRSLTVDVCRPSSSPPAVQLRYTQRAFWGRRQSTAGSPAFRVCRNMNSRTINSLESLVSINNWIHATSAHKRSLCALSTSSVVWYKNFATRPAAVNIYAYRIFVGKYLDVVFGTAMTSLLCPAPLGRRH